MKKNDFTTEVLVILDKEQNEILRKMAFDQRVSKSSLIRDAINEF